MVSFTYNVFYFTFLGLRGDVMKKNKKVFSLFMVVIILLSGVISYFLFFNKVDRAKLQGMLDDINSTCNSVVTNAIEHEEKYLDLFEKETDPFTKGKYASVLVLINSVKGDADNINKYGKLAVENYLQVPGGELFAISENKYIAWSMTRIGRYSDAFLAANELLEIVNQTDSGILTRDEIIDTEALVYSIYLLIYSEFKITDKAKVYYDKLMDIQFTDELLLSRGDKIYYSLFQYAHATENYELMLDISKKSYDLQIELDKAKGGNFSDAVLVNVGVSNLLLGNLDEGLEQVKASEKAILELNDEYSLNTVYEGYFLYYKENGNHKEALKFLIKKLEILKKYNDIIRYNEALNNTIKFISSNNLDHDLTPYYEQFYSTELSLREDGAIENLLSTLLTVNNELNKSKLSAINKTASISKFTTLVLVILTMVLLGLVHRLFTLYKVKKESEKKLSDTLKYDYLTKVYSRKYGYEKINTLINNKINFSLAMIDIDNFKSINDTFGHSVGDDVLKSLCSLFLTHLTGDDFILRAGGEEFIVVFVNKDKNKSLALLEEYKVLSANIYMPNKSILTFSGGIASFNDESLDSLINRADTLLYEAKNTGKNKIL